ncbi:bifunctional adenosylcobinamide kinase/adenosylcobinamide-phosphate guanylyltransferase [Treponema primitia]|uniref:bifunctional adenosylcobinamide kinase/adenosylcobinamide-phosphate guanylyltransferase n=1 Tax=Treponema primitia TaxID=88058 RepID=UPI0002554F6D|nr:bifunctional adenosylcobinamide kinase/adenosylcobinamide-phosphate guanylyltransferase [Treponema primitia]
MIILITGGIKSGKSRRALDIAVQEWQVSPESPVSFIATAEALDDEMKLRIKRHREERAVLGGIAGRDKAQGFITIEEPLELDRAIAAAGQRVLVDCLALWVNNIMYYKREDDFPRLLESSISEMKDCIVVTNETGLGNVPFDETTRRYNLLLAEANRRIAAAADRVELMVSGIPLRVK